MKIIPLHLKQANDFVDKHHRHNKKVLSHKFSLGLEKDGKLVGVSIAARPIARLLDNGKTLEIRRVCVLEGNPNACSKLLARMKQLGQLMGYERVITYTLQSESGSSLRAINARCSREVKPSNWKRKGKAYKHQPVYDEYKYRWELHESTQPESEK